MTHDFFFLSFVVTKSFHALFIASPPIERDDVVTEATQTKMPPSKNLVLWKMLAWHFKWNNSVCSMGILAACGGSPTACRLAAPASGA